MVVALIALNAKIRALARELNSTSITGARQREQLQPFGSDRLHGKNKRNSIYIFSAISRPRTATGAFTINGMSGNGIVDVVNESRTLSVMAGTFGDSFAANDAHVYKINVSAVACNSGSPCRHRSAPR